MRSKGSRFTLGVWGLSCVRQTLRYRSQPSATVRNRSQMSAQGRCGRAYSKIHKRDHFWSFPASRSFVSRGRRGTLWHSYMFHDVSKIVCVCQAQYFCNVLGRCGPFSLARALLSAPPRSFCVAVAALWTACCVFLANRIVSAARNGDKEQIPWQAWHFVNTGCNVVLRGKGGTLWHSNMFHDVSKMVLRGKRNIITTFFTRCVAFFMAGATLWRPPMSCCVAGAAL